MSNLELNHIYKVYPNGTKAVNDFSMEIKDKEFIVFVGPSGCGKSTTLRMIAGLEDITAGECRIDGLVVNDAEPKERDIAMVFQNYALYPHMTVYNNMAFGLKLRHMPKDEIDRRVREAAEILGITDYLNRKPKAMSGGQRQRVALGRAIVREPKVFLLDEPLSNLDAKLRAQMRTEISKLHEKLQTTFIYVTHDQVEAMTMGTRIVVMKSGYVQQIDTPQNLYRYPTNKFVAGFIGTPQMNFLDVTLTQVNDKVMVKFLKTDTVLKAPIDLFSKVDNKYLDGKTEVCLGIRSEHLSTDSKKYPYKAKMKISHIEDLGVDSQIYADLDVNNDEIVGESPTRVIVRGATGLSYKMNDVIEISVDLEHIQLFDKETEETITPRLPKVVKTTAKVVSGVLYLYGAKIELPPAIKLSDGEYTVSIPTDAITKGKTFRCQTNKVEKATDKVIYSLKYKDQYLFYSDSLDSEIMSEGIRAGVDIDIKKLTFTAKDVEVKPLEMENVIKGIVKDNKTVREHVNQKGKTVKIKRHYCTITIKDEVFVTNNENGLRLLNQKENKIFKDEVEIRFTPYDACLLNLEGLIADGGIPVEVTEIIDYGKETFAKCKVDEETSFYVSCPKSVSLGANHVKIDIDKVHAYSIKKQIRLM